MVKLNANVSHGGVGYLVEYVADVADVTVGGTWLTVMVQICMYSTQSNL